MLGQSCHELRIKRHLNRIKEENDLETQKFDCEKEVFEEIDNSFAELSPRRLQTIHALRSVADDLDEVNNAQKRLNVSGGVLSFFGKSHT
jgi:hypothetical protein